MRYLTIANVVFWILGTANSVLLSYLSFDAALILKGQVWRLFTFMLYPPSTGMLAFLVFYFYYWMGSTLEQVWGTPQFNIYILIGWALTVIYGMLAYLLGGYRIRINAQYLYLSMFFPMPHSSRTSRYFGFSSSLSKSSGWRSSMRHTLFWPFCPAPSRRISRP